MSWDEYNNMFYTSQKSGEYHLFIFDIRGSKKGYNSLDILELRKSIFCRLKKIELERNIKIIHTPIEEIRGDRSGILGDLFSIIIIRDTLQSEDVYQIFTEEKKRLNILYEFHYDDGFYETDDWILGLDMYYREYCILFLDNKSKHKSNTL
jgi:hypothetical protein